MTDKPKKLYLVTVQVSFPVWAASRDGAIDIADDYAEDQLYRAFFDVAEVKHLVQLDGFADRAPYGADDEDKTCGEIFAKMKGFRG